MNNIPPHGRGSITHTRLPLTPIDSPAADAQPASAPWNLEPSDTERGNALLLLSPHTAAPGSVEASGAASTQAGTSALEVLPNDPLSLVSRFLQTTAVAHEARTSTTLKRRLLTEMQARARVARIVQGVARDVASQLQSLGAQDDGYFRGKHVAEAFFTLGQFTWAVQASTHSAPKFAAQCQLAAGQPALAAETYERFVQTRIDLGMRYYESRKIRRPAEVFPRDLDIGFMAQVHVAAGNLDEASRLLEKGRANRDVDSFVHARLTAMLAFSRGATAAEAHAIFKDQMSEAILRATKADAANEPYVAPVENPVSMAEFCGFIGDIEGALRYLETAAAQGIEGIAHVLNSRLCDPVANNFYWRSAKDAAAALVNEFLTALGLLDVRG